LKAESARGATAFDAHVRFGTKPNKILHHGAGLELKSEVIGKIGNDAAVDMSRGQLASEIGQGVVQRLFNHQAKILAGMRFGELRDTARDNVNRSHVFKSVLLPESRVWKNGWNGLPARRRRQLAAAFGRRAEGRPPIPNNSGMDGGTGQSGLQ